MSNTRATTASTTGQPAPAVTLLLATDRAISRTRDSVTFILAIDNAGPGDVTLSFSSSQVYDVRVMAGDAEVWHWAGDRGFGQVITDRTFPPGVTLLGRETWDWRDLAGKPVLPGAYRAVPSLEIMPPQAGNAIELTLDVP